MEKEGAFCVNVSVGLYANVNAFSIHNIKIKRSGNANGATFGDDITELL